MTEEDGEVEIRRNEKMVSISGLDDVARIVYPPILEREGEKYEAAETKVNSRLGDSPLLHQE